KVTTDFGPGYSFGRSVAMQSDGKVVLAGSSSGVFALARYTTNGTLDASFGVVGKLTMPTGEGRSMALQSDGKIVVAGSTSSDFGLVRYTASGALDASFGTGGSVST